MLGHPLTFLGYPLNFLGYTLNYLGNSLKNIFYLVFNKKEKENSWEIIGETA
jgi:hypothetical protein